MEQLEIPPVPIAWCLLLMVFDTSCCFLAVFCPGFLVRHSSWQSQLKYSRIMGSAPNTCWVILLLCFSCFFFTLGFYTTLICQPFSVCLLCYALSFRHKLCPTLLKMLSNLNEFLSICFLHILYWASAFVLHFSPCLDSCWTALF